ncbi:SEC31 [Candida jiufengensis]|uniref:SEC31 n=1 Tax=Candida jiufengensis TaxID=497108 RepID=UPI002224465B|nr:SEC31 [Candida jiufengensis]KAI5951687.1 SEC31 [Candida jiufengensis]
MVKISEINRTSTFAWSSDSLPLLVTGTVAGTVDIDFSSSATLELWDIFSPTNNDKPIFTSSVENRFNALAWSKPFEGKSKGIIAGAFENGDIEFWDAEILIKTKDLSKASIHKAEKSKGVIKSLQFNPIQPHILVTGGTNGSILIWDTKTFKEPFGPGQAMTPMDEVSCVSWNNSVSHIFASTGNSGYTSIWDLKSKKEVLHLSYNGPSGRANFSHVAWHPTKSTQLVTSSDNDSCPLILTWDLRNSNAPEKVLEGHKKGVLSLDWCKQDPDLLISSGKDNSTLLWNPIEGKKLGEYPTTANWAFKTRFAPSAPDIFATASFDGKIIIQTIQDTSPPVSTKVAASNDDNEFWSELSVTETQQPVFETRQAPAWLKTPISASFGFGSKLVIVKNSPKSVVTVEKFLVKGHEKSDKIFKDLKNEDYESIIDTHLKDDIVNDLDKADWEVLKNFSKHGKKDLFNEQEPEEKDNKKNVHNNDDEEKKDGEKIEVEEDDFFSHLGNGKATTSKTFVPSGDFTIYKSSSSDIDKKLINLILKNKIEDAVESSLSQDKLIDALVLALDASASVKENVKNAYFEKYKTNSLSRVIYNVSSKNVTDLVAHANVDNFKEIAIGITSFTTDTDEYNKKMSELGDRLLEADKKNRDNAITCYLAGSALDKIANLWLQELPDLESDLLKSDTKDISTPSEARLQALTNFVEKIATYRHYSKTEGIISGPLVEPISKAILEFVNLVAGTGEFDLADKFLQLLPSEFAGVEKERILKATGKDVANTSVKPKVEPKPLPKNLPKKSAYSNVSNPITPQSQYQPPQQQPQHSQYQPQHPQQQYNKPSSIPQIPPISQQPPISQPINNYATSAPKSNPYARANPYAPSNIYKATTPTGAPQAQANTGIPPPPPPSGGSRSKQETEGWNDLPDSFKSKASAPRRPAASAAATATTPSPGPLTSQPSQSSVNSFGPLKRTVSTNNVPPPPPKSASRTVLKSTVPTQPISSPKPQHSNKYAPPPGVESAISTPGFTAPSTANASPRAAKKNPYAPTTENIPSKITYASPPAQQFSNGPPAHISLPPKNPYAPPPSSNLTPSKGIALPDKNFGSAPPPQQPFGTTMATPIQPPFSGIPPPPPTGSIIKNQPPAKSTTAPPPQPPPQHQQQEPEPEEIKHPKGDRSHISEDSLPIYQSLSKVAETIKPSIPEKYARHGADMEQRLNILFDHLNNEEISKSLIESLKQLSSNLEQKQFDQAKAINVEIATNFSDELGNWHTGLKRLITMAEAMY